MEVVDKLTAQDIENTETKFKRWKNTNDVLLFEDPTVWAFANLTDKQDQPLKLRPYQDMIINDKNRFVQFVAANQIGKTWMICVKGLHHALFNKNSTVIIGSKSERQSTRVLDEIKAMTRRSEINFDSLYDEVNNRTELFFKNGSKIISGPATEGILGYDATLELLDELAFWENGTYFYNQVFEPRTNETKNWPSINGLTMGQIVVVSNPNGRQGIFWDLWKDTRYSHYRFDWLINPKNTKEEWDGARTRFPSDVFDSVYAATFSSAAGGFITKQEWDSSKINEPINLDVTKELYLGGDFAGEDTKGRDVDNTVLYGVHLIRHENSPPEVKLCYQKEYPKRTKKSLVYDEIQRLNTNYNLVKFAYDRMGVGDSVRNDLIDKRILADSQMEVLTHSLPNKSEVYYNLKHLFEQGRVRVPNNVYFQLPEQLMGLRFEKTEGGYIKIHHSKEKIHDDHPDAFANACYAALRLGAGPVSLSLISQVTRKGIPKMEKFECNACSEIFKNYGRTTCPSCFSKRIEAFV